MFLFPKALLKRLSKQCWLLFGVLGLISSFSLQADERLFQVLSNTKNLTANFQQSVKDKEQRIIQQDNGTLTVSSPHQLRWEALSPFPLLIITDGETLWRYDEDLEQVIIQSFTNDIRQVPALLFSGSNQEIKDAWEITAINENQWRLEPKSPSSLFQKMELSVDAQQAPQQLLVTDKLGQSTEIQFSSVILNPTIDAAQFTFVPPEGTDVIQQ